MIPLTFNSLALCCTVDLLDNVTFLLTSHGYLYSSRSTVGAPIRALFDGLSHLFVATGDSRRRRLAATTAELRLAPSLTPGPSPSKKRKKGFVLFFAECIIDTFFGCIRAAAV